jgi:uncharacterized protein YndB with AHSA1/START domain
MTKQKDLKRVVRTRMQKTGESYTAARLNVVGKKGTAKGTAVAKGAAPATPPPDYAALAGMSDKMMAARTGATWAEWVRRLDAFGAADRPHREIADHVYRTYDISGWWSQSVTVGYERIRGLRAIGQRRGGAFEASKSKTFPVPVARVFAAFESAAARKRWLPGVKLTVRKATAPKSMRITWDDGTSVQVWFEAKGPEKTLVAIAHAKLPDRTRVNELKQFWGERLEALAEQLGGKRAAKRRA